MRAEIEEATLKPKFGLLPKRSFRTTMSLRGFVFLLRIEGHGYFLSPPQGSAFGQRRVS